MSRDSLGGPSSTRKPSLHRAKFSFKKVGLGFSNKVGRWAVSIRPNRKKGLKKGLAQASLLGLSFSKSREFKLELPKPVSAGEISEQEASPLDQGLSLLPLKSYISGMFPIACSPALGGGGGVRGIFWPFFYFFFGDGGFCGVLADKGV